MEISQLMSKYEVKDIDGKVKWKIDKELAMQQKLSDDDLEVIGDLYRESNKVEQLMKRLNPNDHVDILQKLFTRWKQIEFTLQDTWKFERNEMYHKDYLLPHCSCPKIDNEDSYPYQRWISSSCIYHGALITETKNDNI